jgi:hypothetical protein
VRWSRRCSHRSPWDEEEEAEADTSPYRLWRFPMTQAAGCRRAEGDGYADCRHSATRRYECVDAITGGKTGAVAWPASAECIERDGGATWRSDLAAAVQ